MGARRIGALVVVALVLNGCGHIGFYDTDDAKSRETGVKFYTPKPYILVSRVQAKDNPIKVEVLYLPDLSKPIFARAVAGLGSSDLSMTFSNGTLAGFGQKTDPKLPETLTSVGGLATAGGGLATALATAAKTRAEAEQLRAQALEIGDGGALVAIADDLRRALLDPSANALTANEKLILASVEAQVRAIGNAIVVPGQPPNPEEAAKTLETAAETWKKGVRNDAPVPNGPTKIFFDKLAKLRGDLERLVVKSKPKPTEQPTVTLYEIDNSGPTTVLKEVPMK